MVTKFFKEFSGDKAAFKNGGYETTLANNIVFIKDEANNGAGACIFTRGMYFADFQSLISALAFVKGINVGGTNYNAAQGGGYVKFEAADPATVVYVDNNGVKIGLSETFVEAHDAVIADVATIKADYLKASDKQELTNLVNDKDAAMKSYVDAEIAKVATSEAFAALEGRVSTLEGEIVTERGRIDSLVNDTIPALGQRITDEAPVTITEAAGSGDVLKTYTFTQNGKEIGKINLAKDLVVSSGAVVMHEGVKCLELTLTSGDVVHIPVTELVDVYTAGDYVTISESNEVSVDKAGIIEGLATDANAQQYAANAKSEAIADADGKLASKANSADVYTKEQANELLGAKANSADVYSKDESDDLLDAKANAADVYSKTDVDGLIAPLAKSADVYSKTEADALLAGKANVGDSYTKAEADTLLGAKANASAVYTKGQVDALVEPKADKTYVDEELAKKADASTTYSKTEVDNLVAPKANAADVYTKAEVDAMFAWERIEA